MESKLLDMRECARREFREIHSEMLRLSLLQQPSWFRPLLHRSRRLKSYTGHDHWSRAWEYPWAILAADLGGRPLRVADIGGGGSPFALYLARHGHDCSVVDPSLNEGAGCVYDQRKSLGANLRSMSKKVLFRAAGINSVWGLPEAGGDDRIRYHADPAEALPFPDGHFDRVFCLSVIEHIPSELWAGCVKEFQRVLRPGGRLVITQDMTPEEANARVYLKLVEACSLELVGDPHYPVPLDPGQQRLRHPGQGYETIGLVWRS
ncbi:MAG TPA: class I SAM-dependent methyltransferase [Candidatus Polarisedimenticolia bacterium]|nr:class I SAM-dependent methyltransferase [Candidatus Polarisedimenticolia bacterium]